MKSAFVMALALAAQPASGVALASPQATAANWGLIGEYRTDGQSVFVDVNSLTGDPGGIRAVEVATVLAHDTGKDAGFRFTAELDCAKHRLRARNARTFNAAGKQLAHDDTVGAWGNPDALAFGPRLAAYVCQGKNPPDKLLGDALPIAAARRHLTNPQADW